MRIQSAMKSRASGETGLGAGIPAAFWDTEPLWSRAFRSGYTLRVTRGLPASTSCQRAHSGAKNGSSLLPPTSNRLPGNRAASAPGLFTCHKCQYEGGRPAIPDVQVSVGLFLSCVAKSASCFAFCF